MSAEPVDKERATRKTPLKEMMRVALQAHHRNSEKLKRTMHPVAHDLLEGSGFGNPADHGQNVSADQREHFKKLHGSLDAGAKDLRKAAEETGDPDLLEAANLLDDFGKDSYGMVAIQARGRDSMPASVAEVIARAELSEEEPLPERDNGEKRGLRGRLRRRDSSQD